MKGRFEELEQFDWDQLFTVDEYIFRLPSTGVVVKQERLIKAFKSMLTRGNYKERSDGLLRDTNGNVRTLYSLRHTYASRRRYEGFSFDDLSVQMGTSVQMLEKHYSHFTVNDNPNLFSGHTKRKQQS